MMYEMILIISFNIGILAAILVRLDFTTYILAVVCVKYTIF